MSVLSQNGQVEYVANGGSTYDIPFYFEKNSHLKFYLDGIEVPGLSGYATGAGNEDGGEVDISPLFPVLPTSPSVLTIFRDVPYTQPDSLTEYGPFRAKSIEKMFDRQTFQVQQLQESLNRTIRLPLFSEIDSLVSGEEGGGKIVKINATGDGLEWSNDLFLIGEDIASSEADIAALQGRMTTAEGDIDQLEIDLSALSAAHDDTVLTVSDHEARLLAIEDIDAAQALALAAIDSRLDILEAAPIGDLVGLISDVEALQAQDEDTAEAILEMQSDIADIQDFIDSASGISASELYLSDVGGTADSPVDGAARVRIGSGTLYFEKRTAGTWVPAFDI